MDVQHRLAAHFRRVADQAEDGTNLVAKAAYVEAPPDDNQHVLAIGRAQASIGDPAVFAPVCDNGLHLRLLADHPPTAQRLAYVASLVEHLDAEPLAHYGWVESGRTYEEHHLTAQLELWVVSEEGALELTDRLIGAHFARPFVIAHRVRAKPDARPVGGHAAYWRSPPARRGNRPRPR